MGTFTLETGLGLLGCGMLLILAISLIIYKVINTMADNKQKREKQEREKIDGLM
tara:strand:- start:433 stop:594 length:162 start_codon:yes stop_codon:yes gene_type:complete